MLVINLLLLSSKFILPCLLSKTGSGPFKYLAFDSRQGVRLCQWRALETHCRRKEFSFLVWSCGLLPQCPAVSNTQSQQLSLAYPDRQFYDEIFLLRHFPMNSFPQYLKGEISSKFCQCGTAIISLYLFCISPVNLNHALSNMVWISETSSLGIYLSS